MSVYEILRSIQNEIISIACQGVAYEKSWPSDFARKEVSACWKNEEDIFRKKRDFSFTPEDLKDIDLKDLHMMGFGNWGKDGIILIPLWAYHYIADGTELTSIMGVVAVKGEDDIDLDVRGGCIAYGFADFMKV